MWSLENTKSASQLYVILVGEDCIVGRKDAKILILNDPSVSRKHAILYTRHPEQNLTDPSNRSILFLKDEGSKYGTFKNGERINNNVEYRLEIGDRVKFGQFQSEFRVLYTPIIVTTSCLETSLKKSLKKSILELGGHMLNEWRPSCTHLVMSSVKVTIKALCSLVSAKPIVLPNYFIELLTSYKSTNAASSNIQPNKYIPPIGEALIENASFDVNNERKNLFQNKTFIFIDEKQFKKLHLGITMGGGTAIILSEDKSDINLILKEGACVIQPLKEFVSTPEKMSFVRSIATLLQSNKKRLIPEPDVGFSVAYCSTEKFCNPDFSVASSLLGSQKLFSQTFSLQEVYVPDTEEKTERQDSREKISSNGADLHKATTSNTLPRQSVFESQDIFSSSKRKHSSSTSDAVPGCSTVVKQKESKRLKTDYNNLSFSDLEEEFNEPLEPPAVSIKDESSFEIGTMIKSNPKEISETNTINEIRIKSSPQHYETETLQETLNVGPDADGHAEVPRERENNIIDARKQSDIVNGHSTSLDIKISSSCLDIPENIPRNLIKVEFVSLIRPRQTPVVREEENGDVINFKKFRKVLPVGARALPKIIGAHELVAYDKHFRTNVEDVDMDDQFAVTNGNDAELSPFSEEERGEFDWESLPS